MTLHEKRLDELGTVNRGRSRHRPRDAAHLYGGPYPFIQTGDIKHANLYVTTFTQTYSETGLEQSRMWPKGTLCITIAANIAETTVLGIDACFPDSVIGFIAKDSECDVRYLKYKFDTIKQQYQRVSRGAAQDNLSLEKLLSFNLFVHKVQEQRRIADVLSSYDGLIENNRRRMALLEESARLLYQEWFVRLRFPGHEHTRLVNGIPEGWEVRPLGRCVTFLSGGTPSKSRSDYWEGDIPWVSSGEMTVPRIHDSTHHVTAEAIDAGSRLVPSNTILAVVRGMSLAKEFRVCITARPVSFNQDLKAFACEPDVDPVYLFNALIDQRDQIRDRATEASHGTKKLDTPVLAGVPILVPSETWQKRFREFANPWNSQWDNLHQQNDKLRAARDMLLPRLMNETIPV